MVVCAAPFDVFTGIPVPNLKLTQANAQRYKTHPKKPSKMSLKNLLLLSMGISGSMKRDTEY